MFVKVVMILSMKNRANRADRAADLEFPLCVRAGGKSMGLQGLHIKAGVPAAFGGAGQVAKHGADPAVVIDQLEPLSSHDGGRGPRPGAGKLHHVVESRPDLD